MSLQSAVWNYMTGEFVLLENNVVLDTVTEENLVSGKKIGGYSKAPTTPPVCCSLDPPKHLWHTAVPTVFVAIRKFFSNQKILCRLQKCNYVSHSPSLLAPCAGEELFLHQCMLFGNGNFLQFSEREAETTEWFLFTFVAKQQHSALTVEQFFAVLQDALLHLQFVQQKFTHSFTNHYYCLFATTN